MQQTENDSRKEPENGGMNGRETDIKAGNEENTDEKSGTSGGKNDTQNTNDEAAGGAKYAELNDRYLRLYSEFDNYRKRSLRERADLIKTASEEVLTAILPVIDDFERAIRASESVTDAEPVKEGMKLIYNKLRKIVQQKGLQSFDSIGETFDPDTMEAVTHIDAGDDTKKGKVIDEIEKGYRLGEKVIRHARVVVGR